MSDKRQRVRVQGGFNQSKPASGQKAPVTVSGVQESAKELMNAKVGDMMDIKFDPTAAANVDIQRKMQLTQINDDGWHTLDEQDGTSGEKAEIFLNRQFLPNEEATRVFQHLLTVLPWENREGRTRQGVSYLEPRLTCWYGPAYAYSSVRWTPRLEWDPELSRLREQLSRVTGHEYNSVLCNLYRHGKDGVDWHADNEPELGENPFIASLSFGAARNFQLCRKKDYQELRKMCELEASSAEAGTIDVERLPWMAQMSLGHGDLLLMKGAVQQRFLHRVPKEYHDRTERINLTFRWIYG